MTTGPLRLAISPRDLRSIVLHRMPRGRRGFDHAAGGIRPSKGNAAPRDRARAARQEDGSRTRNGYGKASGAVCIVKYSTLKSHGRAEHGLNRNLLVYCYPCAVLANIHVTLLHVPAFDASFFKR